MDSSTRPTNITWQHETKSISSYDFASVKYNLLATFQSRFRRCHSTETATLRIATDILTSNDDGKVTALVLLDLSAAFDSRSAHKNAGWGNAAETKMVVGQS